MPVSRNPSFVAYRSLAFAIGSACFFGAAAEVAPARAEVSEVRLVRQFGIHYLPLVIMEHENLIEKNAAADGQKDVKVTWARLSGGASVNDALLAKAVDLIKTSKKPVIPSYTIHDPNGR